LKENQEPITERLESLTQQLDGAREQVFKAGLAQQELNGRLQTLQQEGAEVERRPGSDLPGLFRAVRTDLAQERGLDESTLPFV
ncbi:ATP-binding protein, partial [Pseudomonas aeruginosa]